MKLWSSKPSTLDKASDFYHSEVDTDNVVTDNVVTDNVNYSDGDFGSYEKVCGSEPRSDHWPTVRAHWLKTNGSCAACGTNEHLQVHHVVPFHTDMALELDSTNFITLCMTDRLDRRCHFVIGHHCNWKNSNPNVRDDAAKLLIERTK